MKVKDLIEKLLLLPQDMEVTILDGFNGGGMPRTINFGPLVDDPKSDLRTPGIVLDSDDYSDIETPEGEPIVVMGYGCY